MTTYHSIKTFLKNNANVLFFVGGFIFDTLTMIRIDSTLDLLLQFAYLAIITGLIIAQARLAQERWTPSGWLGKIWHFETEALHFCYGGLLSGYVIFYFKSTSFSRSLVFLTLIGGLMLANEMPQVRKWGVQLRLGLYAFCVVSYLNYLLPVLIGQMGRLIFLLAWVLSAGVSYAVVRAVARYAHNPSQFRRRSCISPAAILLLIFTLYGLKLIPPVPLSLQHLGIYRSVAREGARYRLEYRKPEWHHFWQTDNRLFPARPGDTIWSFISVFGPKRFTHRIFIHWSKWDPRQKKWLSSDRFPIDLIGGRDNGFRGFMKKNNYDPGKWKVEIETEDARVLGSKTLKIEPDNTTTDRQFHTEWL